MKSEDWLGWLGAVNNIHSSAEEIICNESHEPPALLVVCCWPYGADVTFPPKGGLTNHCLVTLPPKGGSVSHCLVTGGRLKAALCYLAYSPSIWSRSYCSLMYFLIVSSFTLPTVSQ